MTDRTYPGIGAVRPHVRAAAIEIGNKFDVSTIYGIGARSGVSEHPIGLALDFMVFTDRAKGDQIAAFVLANWKRLGVKYIIWKQRINNGGGWEAMEDRGGVTANHFDHDHVSFEANPSDASTPSDPTAGDDPTKLGHNYTEGSPFDIIFSGKNFLRVVMFFIGLALASFAIWSWVNG